MTPSLKIMSNLSYSAEGCGDTNATSTPLPTFAVEPSTTNQTESKSDFQFPNNKLHWLLSK